MRSPWQALHAGQALAGIGRQACGGTAALLLAAALGGCAANGPADPVAWWHQLEGGRIAEARPAPPNADAPYPRLVTVPARPVAIGAADRARIAGKLAADRANAEYAAATVPLTMPAASAPPAAAQAAGGANATMVAASAPPPAAPAAPRRAAMRAAGAATAPFPAIPLAPPPPPRLPGVPAATNPTPAPIAPPPSAAKQPPVAPGQPVPVAFPVASATLPPEAASALARLAATRGAADMRVTGFGDAPAGDAAAQAAALPLAYARAEAIATALARAGVPRAAMRLTAAAEGHGGVAAVAN